MTEQLFNNLLTLLVIIVAFFLIRKIQKPENRNKNENIKLIDKTKHVNDIFHVKNFSENSCITNEDLIAVISTAVHVFIGHTDFKIIKIIKRKSNNWQLVGRQNLMNSRM